LHAFTAADVALLVFARAPVPGRAKTRLIARLGEWGAARLQARLTARTLRTARAAGFAAVELHATPGRHAFFTLCKREFLLPVKSQTGKDLGERMHRALRDALRRHRAAIVVGTDCPILKPQDLRLAARWLRGGCDAVIAPAEDGGYALVGMRKVCAGIFSGIEWGGVNVYRETAKRLDAAGYRWRALRTVWDVDRPADLDRLATLRFRSRRSS